MPEDRDTAVVLAAGEGRRLEPLTNRRPKPMVPVANEPLLEYVVEAVSAAGFDRIVVVVGYHQERIRNHFRDGDDWDIEIVYVEQERQLGTGHAVLQAESAVDGEFVVMNGDRIVDASVVRQVRDTLSERGGPVMSITSVDSPREYGVVTLDADNRVGRIDEKPEGPVQSNRINAGVYGFSETIFDAIRDTTPAGELALTDTLNHIAGAEPIPAVSYRGTWMDVSHLWDLLAVNASLVNEHAGESRDRATTAGDIEIAPNVTLGDGAVVRGSTALGENAVIGANAVIENAVVFPDAVIEAGVVVRDAVVASNARIGANTTIVGGESTVVVDGEAHQDVRLGGVIGDNAVVGGGATLDAGTVIGDDATVDPGAVLEGRFEPGAVIRRA